MNTMSYSNLPPNSPKCEFAAQLVPMAQHCATNPWGDFAHMLVLHFRPPGDFMPFKYPGLYFKINAKTGQPSPMTEEEFKDACVQSVLEQAQRPWFVSLPHDPKLPGQEAKQ